MEFAPVLAPHRARNAQPAILLHCMNALEPCQLLRGFGKGLEMMWLMVSLISQFFLNGIDLGKVKLRAFICVCVFDHEFLVPACLAQQPHSHIFSRQAGNVEGGERRTAGMHATWREERD